MDIPDPVQETKECPFCAEVIKVAAIKCRFCGEMLDGSPSTVAEIRSARTETIEISWELVKKAGFVAPNKFKWIAVFYGAEGKRTLFESHVLEGSRSMNFPATPKPRGDNRAFREARAALDALIEELVRNGWGLPTVFGRYYWDIRLTRPATELSDEFATRDSS